MSSLKCLHCGACCTVDTDIVKPSDVERWKAEGRRDILNKIKMVGDFPAGFKEDKCPFYDKNLEKGCLIEDTKPLVCRNFPLNKKHAMGYTKGKCVIFEKKYKYH